MVIFGTRAIASTPKPVNAQCNFCESYDIYVGSWQSYFHVWWIPTLPTGKSYFAICNGCGQETFPNKEVSNDATLIAEAQADQIPLWTFSGLGIGVIVTLGVFLADLTQ